MAGGLCDLADPTLAVGSPSELATASSDGPSASQALECAGLGRNPHWPPTCRTGSESSGSWGEWPLPGPSLGGAVWGGGFLHPDSLSPRPQSVPVVPL